MNVTTKIHNKSKLLEEHLKPSYYLTNFRVSNADVMNINAIYMFHNSTFICLFIHSYSTLFAFSREYYKPSSLMQLRFLYFLSVSSPRWGMRTKKLRYLLQRIQSHYSCCFLSINWDRKQQCIFRLPGIQSYYSFFIQASNGKGIALYNSSARNSVCLISAFLPVLFSFSQFSSVSSVQSVQFGQFCPAP